MYAYCNNNPVNYVDPTGTSAIEVYWFVKAFVFVVATLITWLGIAEAQEHQYSDAGAISHGATSDLVDSAPKSIAQSREKEKSKEKVLTDPPKVQYWSATISDGVVTPISPLTYSEAREHAASGKDVLCANHSAARAIVKFYPTAIWEPAHGGGPQCGYLNHYHLSSAHDNHIWYYGE